MSIRTIYKCDKCGKEQETNNQFWFLKLIANCGESPASGYTHSTPVHQMQVCRECLEAFGIHVTRKEIQPQVQYPTFEDIVYDMVHNIIQDELNNRG